MANVRLGIPLGDTLRRLHAQQDCVVAVASDKAPGFVVLTDWTWKPTVTVDLHLAPGTLDPKVQEFQGLLNFSKSLLAPSLLGCCKCFVSFRHEVHSEQCL